MNRRIKMKGALAIAALAALLGAILLTTGCVSLKEDGKETVLPTRGYGSFKMSSDDPGPEAELDEIGVATGRRGFLYDFDQDGNPDLFYQIRRPTAGITALSFGPDGYANGALAVALARLVPGQTEYEIPMESLTSWIKGDQAIGYRKAQYIDQPNILVYTDRVFDKEAEAPLTGQRKTIDYRFYNFGVLNLGAVGAANPNAGQSDEEMSFPEGSVNPLADDDEEYGAEDPRCTGWRTHCDRLASCAGGYANEKNVETCAAQLFAFTKTPAGQRYITCVGACNADAACGDYQQCRQICWNDNFQDAFSCPTYGPEANDVVLIVQRGAEMFRVAPGYVVQEGEKLGVYIDYKDVEGDFAGGWITVQSPVSASFPVTVQAGHSSLEDGALLGFTIASPLPAGDYQLTIRLEDGGPCKNQGVPFPVRFSSAGVTAVDATLINGGEMFGQQFDSYEIYDTALNRYNLGKGFIDVNAFSVWEGYTFMYELMQFDVAIAQAYVWSYTGLDTFDAMTSDEFNRAIFTTTHNTNDTKFTDLDDTQAMSFYIDQPMTAGLFTFYGDEGWNIYPIGPYGDNEDQPFVRGDFDVTRVHMPFAPFFSVDPRYTGCADTCKYWVDQIYSPEINLTAPGFNSYAEALQDCQAHSANDYWTALVNCFRRVEGSIQACVSLRQCLAVLPPTGGGPALCDTHDNIPLKFSVTVPPEYLASATYGPMLTTPGRLAVGVLGQSAAGWELVPGSYVEFNVQQQEYTIGLPYMPSVPTRFIGTSSAESSVQAQLYYGLFDLETQSVVGTGYYAPSAVYEDGDWFYLLIYTYNWTDPAQEGWAVGIVSANTIYDFVDPATAVLGVTFGDNRAIQEDILPP